MLPDAQFCPSCGESVLEEPIHVRLSKALGTDFQVMGELGRGGFAVVYSVKDQRRNRYLAVKVMRPELLSSATTVERFRREARYVAGLDHPNILTVTFAAEHSDLVYYAMPRVTGQPLNKIIKGEKQLPIKDTQSILKDVGAGLYHAHTRGVVHRDIKPTNVMREDSGRSVILDFGIAKALSGSGAPISLTGEAIGTPHYMSPEQCSGDKNIDARTDIYSWAALGFEMLAGRPPFDGSTARDIMNMHLGAKVPDVRKVRPDTPDRLANALTLGLQKEPSARFASMGDALKWIGDP